MVEKPKMATSGAAQELDKAEKQLEAFEQNVKELTMDRMNAAPKQELDPQTKISQKDLAKTADTYLKPIRTISCKDKFNEKFREDFNFAKEYVHFIAENKELIGEAIDMWTKPFPGVPAEEWKVPCNKPVWAPRYVAEQIKRKLYHRLVMQQRTSAGADSLGEYYGSMAIDTTVQRLDAIPVTQQRSVFMGAKTF